MAKIHVTKEHHQFSGEALEDLINLKLEFSPTPEDVKFLGLSSTFQASYYVGIDWLNEKHDHAIQVNPKIERLDYFKMFSHCFNSPEINPEISKIYKIFFDSEPIKIESTPFEITPLLIVHFLNVMKTLVKKGLKKDYILLEENLSSKLKGKLLFNSNFKQNITKGRSDKNYCRYQEYSVNCIENQILKKALNFVRLFLVKNSEKYGGLSFTLNYCYSALEKVSDEVDIKRVQQVKINPLYKEYFEALRLAKMIFRRFSYSLKEVTNATDNKIPPFYIDMSLLFECYVLSKLKEKYGKEILYQVSGKYGITDFLKKDDKMIIDTKYKLIYNQGQYEIENIRQISAYARDKGILSKLSVDDDTVVDCLIIYPNKYSDKDFMNRDLKENEIPQFSKFYKTGICLPLKHW